jgi:hypothetical protein
MQCVGADVVKEMFLCPQVYCAYGGVEHIITKVVRWYCRKRVFSSMLSWEEIEGRVEVAAPDVLVLLEKDYKEHERV